MEVILLPGNVKFPMMNQLSTRIQGVISFLFRPNRWNLPWIKALRGYGGKNEEQLLSRIWETLLPNESISSVETMMKMGLFPMLICPDISLAAEAIRSSGAVKGQKPYLALAVFGYRPGTTPCEAFGHFVQAFDAGKMNQSYEIEYDNVTLNLSNIFKPGEGIVVADIKRLIEGNSLEVLEYRSREPLSVQVNSKIREKCKTFTIDKNSKTEEFSIRALPEEISSGNFRAGSRL